MTDCPDDWREQIFNPRHPVIPWLRIKDFKLVSLKMIVSSMLLHQRRKIKKDLTRRLLLQALDQNTPDKTPADSDAAHVSHTGERGFPSALHRLRLTTVSRHSLSGSGVATPACKQSSSGATLSDMHEEWIDGVCVPNTQMAEEPDSDAGGDTGGDAGGGVASQPSAPNALIQRVLAMGTLGKEPAASATQAEPASLAPSRNASLDSTSRLSSQSSWQSLRTTSRLSSQSSWQSLTSSPRELNERVPSLLTLGADLYVSGEVTEQQLGFPTSTTLIVSVDNPGAEALVKVSLRVSEPTPPLGSNPTRDKTKPHSPPPQPTPRGAGRFVFERIEPASPRDLATSCGRRFSVNTLTCAPSPPTVFSPHRRHDLLSSARSRCASNCRTWHVSRANPDAHTQK